MIKKILLIVAGLALLGGLVAALIIFQPWGLIGWDRTPGRGNTNANLRSGYPAVQDGEFIFFVESTASKTITKMTVDGQQRQTLPYDGESTTIQSLNLVGDWLYYSSSEGIRKMRIDGTEYKKVCSDQAYRICVLDGWIYYLFVDGDKEGIARIRTNGTGRQQLSALGADFMNISDDGWIYYVNRYDTGGVTADHHIYRMRLDGSEHTKISEEKCGRLQLDGEWLYYLSKDPKTENRLYRMRTDGTEVTELLNYNFFRFITRDGWIYYLLRKEGGEKMDAIDYTLRKIRIDGTGHQILAEEPFDYFSLIGDWIYGHTNPDKIFIITSACRIRTDGTGWEILEQ